MIETNQLCQVDLPNRPLNSKRSAFDVHSSFSAKFDLVLQPRHSPFQNGAPLLLICKIARDRELARRLVFTWAQIRARARNPVKAIICPKHLVCTLLESSLQEVSSNTCLSPVVSESSVQKKPQRRVQITLNGHESTWTDWICLRALTNTTHNHVFCVNCSMMGRWWAVMGGVSATTPMEY